jgi:hypothetical protein
MSSPAGIAKTLLLEMDLKVAELTLSGAAEAPKTVFEKDRS